MAKFHIKISIHHSNALNVISKITATYDYPKEFLMLCVPIAISPPVLREHIQSEKPSSLGWFLHQRQAMRTSTTVITTEIRKTIQHPLTAMFTHLQEKIKSTEMTIQKRGLRLF